MSDSPKGILEKLGFISIIMAEKGLDLLEWTNNWIEWGPEIAKYIGSRIYQAYDKRKKAGKLLNIIEHIIGTNESITKDQKASLEKLPDFIKNNDAKLRKLIASDIPLRTACKNWLLNNGISSDEEAEKISHSIVKYVREILLVSVSMGDIYREQISFREEIIDLLQEQRNAIVDRTSIAFSLPTSFTPLDRKLLHDLVLNAFVKDMNGESDLRIRSLTQGQFFRKPHPCWIDIADGCIMGRDEIIQQIENNFSKSNMQLLVGESGAGKTTLSHILGFRRLTDIRPGKHGVYYIDFMDHDNEKLERDLNLIMESITAWSRISGDIAFDVLFILDNIHLSPKYASSIYEKLRIIKGGKLDQFEEKFDFLFLARTQNTDLEKALEEIVSKVAGSPDASGLLERILLRKKEFNQVTKEILESFLISKGQSIKNIETSTKYINTRCQRSLWLLSFIIQSCEPAELRMISFQNPVDEKQVCVAFEKYYYNILQNIERDDFYQIESVDFSEKEGRQHTSDILMILAMYNRFEIPIDESILRIILEVTSQITNPARALRVVLKNLLRMGEVVTVGDGARITFPHRSIAEQMVSCFNHALTISCMKFLCPSKEIIERPAFEWVDLIQKYAAESLVNRFIIGIISEIKEISDHLELAKYLLKNSELLDSFISQPNNMKYVIFDLISIDFEQGMKYALKALTHRECAVNNAFILPQRIVSDERFIEYLIEVYDLTDDILVFLQSFYYAPVLLMDKGKFGNFLISKVDEIIELIPKNIGDRAWFILEVISRFDVLRSNSRMKKVVFDFREDIILYIQESDTPQFAMNVVREWEHLAQDSEIQSAIIERTDYFIEKMNSNEDEPLSWMAQIVDVELLINQKEVRFACIELIRRTPELLRALWICSRSRQLIDDPNFINIWNSRKEYLFEEICNNLSPFDIAQIPLLLTATHHDKQVLAILDKYVDEIALILLQNMSYRIFYENLSSSQWIMSKKKLRDIIKYRHPDLVG